MFNNKSLLILVFSLVVLLSMQPVLADEDLNTCFISRGECEDRGGFDPSEYEDYNTFEEHCENLKGELLPGGVHDNPEQCDASDPSPGSRTLSGFVFFNDTLPAPNVLVGIVTDIEGTTSSSNEEGAYFVEILNQEISSITFNYTLAQRDDCPIKQRSFNLNPGSNQGLNVTLDCPSTPASPPEEVIPPEIIAPDDRICSPATGQFENVACNPITGEFFGEETCQDFGFQGGELTCSNSCRINTDGCFNCPSNPNQCTTSMCGGNCPTCEGTAVCQNFCEESEILLQANQLYPINQEFGAFLEWDYPTTCNLIKYELFRCEAEGGSECNPNTKIPTSGAWNNQYISYEDKSSQLKPATTYCYRIDGTIRKNNEDVVISSEVQCVIMPDLRCLGPNTQSFCVREDGQDYTAQCDSNNQLILNECPAGERCTTNEQGAMCVATEVCELCSGVLGLFGYIDGLDIPQELWEFESSVCERNFLEQQSICYFDDYSSKNTLVGDLKECPEVNSCYDYYTQNSCTNDPCNVNIDCEWEDFNEFLGLGVCRPKEQALQDCTKCDENNIFNGVCSQELCALYADDTCFYNSKTNEDRLASNRFAVNEFTCMNIQDVGCETFDTKEQCIGASEQDFQVAIAYDQNNQKQGSNERLQLSDDLIGFGVCYWNEIEQACFRDADNTRTRTGTFSDCTDRNDLRCLTDNVTPTTSLFIFSSNEQIVDGMTISKVQIQNMFINVSDNAYSSEQLRTYFALAGSSGNREAVRNNVYPNKLLSNLIITPGPKTLSFFSKDPAKNHEQVQEVNIEVVEGILININYTITSEFDEVTNTFISDLEIYFNQVLDNLYCKGALTTMPGGQLIQGNSDLRNVKYNNFSYSNMNDGNYNLQVTCSDDFDQTKTKNFNILIQEDKTINTVAPRGDTFRSNQDVIITLQTQNPAISCDIARYDTQDWRSMERITQTSFKLQIPSDEIENSGLYFYNTRCDIQDIGQFIGTSAHMAYFAIDDIPPTYNLTSNGQSFNQTEIVNYLDLRIECIDEDDSLKLGSTSFDFGCGGVRYCTYPSSEFEGLITDNVPSEGDLDDAFTITRGCNPNLIAETIDQNNYRLEFEAQHGEFNPKALRILIYDLGGNNVTINRFLPVFDTDFEPPEVIIE